MARVAGGSSQDRPGDPSGLASHPRARWRGGGCRVAAAWSRSISKPAISRTAAVLGRFRLFTLAESLGAVESLVGRPWTMSHASLPEAGPAAPRHSAQSDPAVGRHRRCPEYLADDLERALSIL
ncbi:MAG: PLP-dependent transferase [Rhodopseudomonas palustris]|nr:PLP-dependent transferase [Rhodopseudomonas palustris]